MANTEANDYSTGVPRRHHSFYIEDGSLVLQVENAIFKVHRSYLSKCSAVIKDMIGVAKSNEENEGSDEKPLVFTGDKVSNWELLLESQYDSPNFWDPDALTNARLLAILPVAHKYCMEAMERTIIKRLQKATWTEGYIDLMVASQLVGSRALYDEALKGLRDSPEPNLSQAKRIGFDAYFAVMSERL